MVFGGIIQYTGTVEVLSRLKLRVTVPSKLAAEAQLGDSIAINGVCLTVVAKTSDTFDFDLSEETVSRTTLSKPPAVVHVEAALKLSDAVGGHLISGHVHNVGTLVSLDAQTGDMIVDLPSHRFPQRPMFKDSIAIDGVSLTVAELLPENRIRIALIPHTMKLTLFTSLAPGSPVNVELNAASRPQPPTASAPRQPDATRDEARDDVYWMRQAIAEGEKSRYTAPPNPWVGAVLVDPWGTQIASGRHVRPGEPHAERMIVQPMEGCTLYVTLEPCCHYGRTPPCVEYLVEKRPARVVVGTLDPDSRVRGQGVAALRAAGVDVLVGVAEDDVRYSLRAYLWHRQHGGQPYIVCKLALSQDNCFAYKSDCVEKRSWITGVPARRHSHGERASSQRLVVGKLTSVMDKPQLTVRYGFEVDRQPEAVVSTRELTWARPDAEVLQVLVEGGPELEEDLLRRRMVNEFLLYRSTKFLGLNGVRWMPSFANDDWRLVETKTFEDGDTMQRFVLKEAAHSSPRLPLSVSTTTSSMFSGDAQLGRVGSATRGGALLVGDSVTRDQRDAPDNTNGNTGDADNEGIRFDTLKTALAALQRGELIIVMDDANRENEGDLMVLADRITMRTMKFLLAHTTGIVCATLTQTRASQLGLPLMVAHDKNSDPHRTKFTVSVDAAVGVTTGVSAADRLKTLSLLASTTSNGRDFNRPGHIFPLVAAPGGLLQRRGHTEAGVELARLAGMTVPVMAISELYDASTGRMMTRAQCRELGFPMITIDTILGGHGSPLWATVPLQQHAGNWKLSVVAGHKCMFLPPRDSASLPAQSPDRDDASAVPSTMRRDEFVLRIHSECFTGDVLGSSLCDCGNQLHAALDYIAAANESTGCGGMVVFPPEHEGRGIGLEEKVKVYALQREKGMDTFAANQALGHPEDARDFSGVVWVLQHLGVRPDTHHVTLLTENPAKVNVIESAGYHVRTVTLSCAGTPHNVKYLADKRERFSQQQRERTTELPSNPPQASHVPHVATTARVGASLDESVQQREEESDAQTALMKQAPKPMALTADERSFLAEWTVCIVQAEWHRHLSDVLVDTIVHALATEYGIGRVQREFAPGSFELPRVIQHLARGKFRGSQRRVVFVAVGVLVKGDTDHYDLVARETTANLLRLQLDDELWIVNSVLGCHNMEQVEERCVPASAKCVGPHMAHAVARLALVSRN